MANVTQLSLYLGFLGLLGCTFVPPAAQGATPPRKKSFNVKVVKNVVYHDGPGHDKVKHKLDLYLPEGAKDFPVLFFVHGGAWVHGDKNFLGVYARLARTYARQGVLVVVTNYRLSPGVKHPEHIRDVARAFAWTYRNVGKYGGKADQIFVCGHSAGGHLVSLLCTDETYLKAQGLTTKAVRGAIPVSGVYSIPERVLSHVFGKDGKSASPLTHVKAGLPPFLILYADRDFPNCDRAPSEAFCKALKDAKTDARTLEIKDSNHFKIILSAGAADNEVSNAILKFVRDRAKP
jgi:acetyl esterase/lipase